MKIPLIAIRPTLKSTQDTIKFLCGSVYMLMKRLTTFYSFFFPPLLRLSMGREVRENLFVMFGNFRDHFKRSEKQNNFVAFVWHEVKIPKFQLQTRLACWLRSRLKLSVIIRRYSQMFNVFVTSVACWIFFSTFFIHWVRYFVIFFLTLLCSFHRLCAMCVMRWKRQSCRHHHMMTSKWWKEMDMATETC